MDKESLLEAKKIIADGLIRSNINLSDKLELLINLYHFLNTEEYHTNIIVLQKQKGKRK